LQAVVGQLIAEKYFARQRRVGEIPGMGVDFILIANARKKPPRLQREAVGQAERLDIGLLHAYAVVRLQRCDQGAAEVVVHVRRQRDLGFAQAEATFARGNIAQGRDKAGDLIARRVLGQIGVHTVENYRYGRIEGRLRSGADASLDRGGLDW